MPLNGGVGPWHVYKLFLGGFFVPSNSCSHFTSKIGITSGNCCDCGYWHFRRGKCMVEEIILGKALICPACKLPIDVSDTICGALGKSGNIIVHIGCEWWLENAIAEASQANK